MLSSILSILTLLTMLTAGYGVGRPILRALMRKEEQEPSSTVIWSLLVGWIVIGLMITTLGMAGILYRAVVGIGTLVAAFLGIGEIGRVISERSEDDQDVPSVIRQMLRFHENDTEFCHGLVPPRWLLFGMLTIATIAAIASLFGALAPPTAGDALCYHLELPKRFIEAGRFSFLPYSDNSTYPLLVEVWYLWAMILHGITIQGAIAAQLVHWMCGIMLAMAAFTLARPILGQRWSVIVASIVLLTPGVTNQMTAPLNDVALALMTTMAIAAWWRFAVNREGLAWCVLAGIAAGGALGTKYIAALFAIAVSVSWAWTFVHQKERRVVLLKGAMLVGGIAVLVGGVWYVRAYKYRGNPVYPFLAELHQTSENSSPQEGDSPLVNKKNDDQKTTQKNAFHKNISQKQSVHLNHYGPQKRGLATKESGSGKFETLPKRKAPLGRSPLALLSAPWHISINPDRFGGRSHQLGILFLAGLPGLLFARRLRGLGTLLVTAVAYFILWFLLRQNVRFLFPILPLLSVGLVWVWVEMNRMPKISHFFGMAIFAFILIIYTGVSVRRSLDRFSVACGLEGQRDYLSRCEPSYKVAQKVSHIVGSQGQLLSQDVHHFYFNCPVIQEKVFHRFVSYEEIIARQGSLLAALRRSGFSHVLLIENLRKHGEQFDPALLHLIKAEPNIHLELLETVDDQDGGKRQYFLASLSQKGI